MCELLRRAVGATFTAYDDNSEPGMVDALFVLPDGTPGALEVTTCATQEALGLEAKMAELDDRGIDSPWAWMIEVGDVHPKDLQYFFDNWLEAIDRICRSHCVTDPKLLPGATPSLLARYGIRSMTGSPETSRPGAIYLHPSGDGGMVGDAEGFTGWIQAEIETPLLTGKVAKLQRTGRPEQHLGLRIHESASMPFHLTYHLLDGIEIPTTDPDLPASLTGVWIVGRWKAPVLWWSRSNGWARFDLYATEL